MKHLAIFLFLFSIILTHGQGTILSLNIHPPNPTTSDSITIYANLSFTSGDCKLDVISDELINNIIHANAHHCTGTAAVICPSTDTFKLGKLSGGNYNFNLTLTAGGSPAPCTPGIAIDDTMSLNFTVVQATAHFKSESSLSFNIYPNPAQKVLQINSPLPIHDGKINIYNITGQLVQSFPFQNKINIDLKPGIYFVEIKDQNQTIGIKKLNIIN